ncbi:MAG TPA: ABC transporter permease [Bryobacteraceae bacterium]|nr:ABC transporter permease [Bryobacteraceae bacterium]
MLQDLTYAARILRKAPAFGVTAVVTIALGVGAAAVVFSVTSAVLLRPLPYKNSGRLVVANDLLSNACFYDLRDGARAALEDIAAVMVFRAIVPREDGAAERISKGFVTTNFFRMLGVHTLLGRGFMDADGLPHGRPPPPWPPPQGSVAILSHDYFMRRYGGNPAVLGHYMPGPEAAPGPQIIGVLQPGFKLYLPGQPVPQPGADVWIPNDRGYDEANRGGLMLLVTGVLRPGVTLARAQSQVDRVSAAWGSDRPSVRLESWHEVLVGEFRPALLALMGAVLFLLLIACANVANLLLVRASVRERELAVRTALGARAWRIARQLLAEAFLVCALGTLSGVGLAWVGIRELLKLTPGLPRLDTVSIDWRVLAFAALAGIVETVILGSLPGWRASRPDILRMLRAAGGTAHQAGRKLPSAVVVAEVALSFVLLVGAGLMFRSFLELRRVRLGYDPHGVLTFLAIGDAQGFQEPPRRLAFLRELQDRLRAIPGVRGVGAALGLPLHVAGPGNGIQWSTAQMPPDAARTADLPTVLPGYFETLHSRIVQGRTFTKADNAAARNLAVIDESLAAKAFPGQSALGKRIAVAIPDPTWLEVIGVVEHQRLSSLADPGRDQIFMMDGFWGMGISRHWALRTAGDPSQYAAAVRAAVAQAAPGRLAITEMQTMDAAVRRAQAATRFQLLLIGLFAAIAALLAGVGLYGVLSSAVRRRTAEIGIRMALGAPPARIFRLVIGEGLALSSLGIVIGLAAAFALTRGIAGMLVGITPTDPATFAVIVAFFLVVAAAACWLPASRAAGLDPAASLREE